MILGTQFGTGNYKSQKEHKGLQITGGERRKQRRMRTQRTRWIRTGDTKEREQKNREKEEDTWMIRKLNPNVDRQAIRRTQRRHRGQKEHEGQASKERHEVTKEP